MKIVTVIGARPQFIKAAIVSRSIDAFNKKQGASVFIEEIIIHTGQHYDYSLSDIFFKELKMPVAKYSLGIKAKLHGAMTGRMMEAVEEVFINESPDVVCVYGDTNSTLAGALAAVKLNIPIAHVEAGLRSYNTLMPEEINRVLTDRISKWLFCPTERAVKNLKNELCAGNSNELFTPYIVNAGDVMYDAVMFNRAIVKPSPAIAGILKVMNGNFYVATVHRAENADNYDRLYNITAALDEISEDIQVVMPLHPRTKKNMERFNLSLKKTKIIEPVGYFDMLALLESCKGVLTDSGGVQKEAFFFKKPCITLRDETEWTELVEYGFNFLSCADRKRIIESVTLMEKSKFDWSVSLYGDGNAGEKIVNTLAQS